MDYMKIFPDMVSALAKDGGKIIITLNPQKADLWHGATGVAGEAGELLDAALFATVHDCKIDQVNLVEELGDIEFYLQMVRTNLATPRHLVLGYASSVDRPSYATTLEVFAGLAVCSSDLLDQVKKVVVYNKTQDLQALMLQLGRIEDMLGAIRDLYGITRDTVIEANVTKLATGPNARYKNGYTDQAAQDRADKQAA